MKKTLIYALRMAASTSAAVVLADNNGGDNGEGKDHPHGPPIEAIKACEGKSVGAKVQFETRNGRTINGECKLIAVPERWAEGGGQGGQGGNSNQGPQGGVSK
jgi:hypothetical protein